MNYKLLNEIEQVIKACCIGRAEGVELDHETFPVADTIAYRLGIILRDREITDKDWTLIHANIQSGLAMAASQAMRILGASNDMGVVTHE